MKQIVMIALLVGGGPFLFACGGGEVDGNDNDGQEELTSELEVMDQDVCSDAADTIIIPRVVSDGPGFADAHADADDMPVLGMVSVEHGETTDIEVTLDRDVEDGETLMGMLHTDAAGDGEYDPDTDHVVQVDGEMLMKEFVVSVVECDEE